MRSSFLPSALATSPVVSLPFKFLPNPTFRSATGFRAAHACGTFAGQWQRPDVLSNLTTVAW